MRNIFLKYLGIFFLFYNQVCVITKKMSPEDAKHKCLRSTRVTKSEADDLLLYPMCPAETEYQRCFLQCYFTYSNKIVIATLGKKLDSGYSMDSKPVDSLDPNIIRHKQVVIEDKIPFSVAICIEGKKFSEDRKKCDWGDFNRFCHIRFATDLAKSMNYEIRDDRCKKIEDTKTPVANIVTIIEESKTIIEDNITTPEDNITTPEDISAITKDDTTTEEWPISKTTIGYVVNSTDPSLPIIL